MSISFFIRRIMEALRIYRIEDKYIHYLKSRDDRVQYNKNKRRPYVGIVLYVGKYKYFVPMESPKPNHTNIKSGNHLLKLNDGQLGILGFNNMLPVPETALISFNIDAEEDKKYAELLKRQASYINKNKANIYSHASKTYYNAIKGNNKFLNSICCNFKELEKACNKYNPNYKKQTHSSTRLLVREYD